MSQLDWHTPFWTGAAPTRRRTAQTSRKRRRRAAGATAASFGGKARRKCRVDAAEAAVGNVLALVGPQSEPDTDASDERAHSSGSDLVTDSGSCSGSDEHSSGSSSGSSAGLGDDSGDDDGPPPDGRSGADTASPSKLDVVADIVDVDIADMFEGDMGAVAPDISAVDLAESVAPDSPGIGTSAHRDPSRAPSPASPSDSDEDLESAFLAVDDDQDALLPPPPGFGPPRARRGYSTVRTVGGWIVYNTTTQINGHCGNPAHGKCHFDKRVTYSTKANRSGQGRPLGAIALWLALGEECSREEHQALKAWVCSRAAFDDRCLYRAFLHDDVDTQFLFMDEAERPKYDDTDSEPEVIPN